MPRKPPARALGPDDPERVAETVRDLLRALAPQLKVERRWGHPWYVGNDMVLAVAVYTHHAAIEFWRGTTLKDPKRRLEGTGKNLRHVKLRSVEEATSPEVVGLLREAVRLDEGSEPRAR